MRGRGSSAEEPAGVRGRGSPASLCLYVFMLEVKGQRLTLINLIVTLGVILI